MAMSSQVFFHLEIYPVVPSITVLLCSAMSISVFYILYVIYIHTFQPPDGSEMLKIVCRG